MAVDTSLGGVPRLTSRRFSTQRDAQPSLADRMRAANLQDNFFRQGTAISPEEQFGIRERQRASVEQDALNAQRDAIQSKLATQERIMESQMEGDIAFGKLGDNEPGDTRMAKTLKALGVAPDLMSAIIASAQVPQAHRKPR